VIDTLADPLLALGLALVGEIEKLLQVGGAAPAWLTPKLFPAIEAL
jgi:hypothetical protein